MHGELIDFVGQRREEGLLFAGIFQLEVEGAVREGGGGDETNLDLFEKEKTFNQRIVHKEWRLQQLIAGTTKGRIGIHQFAVDSRERTWYRADLTVGCGRGRTITVEYLPDERSDVPRVARSSSEAACSSDPFSSESYF